MAKNRKPKRRKPIRAKSVKGQGRGLVSVPMSDDKSARMPLSKAIARGVELHQQGDLSQAEAVYRAILQKDAEFFDALHNLGIICFQTGRLNDALEVLEKATGCNTRSAEAAYHRGLVLQMLERHDEAATSYRAAIELKPDYAEAFNNLGLVLHNLRRGDEAITAYDKALALKPDYVNAYINRGNALKATNRVSDALSSYDQAIKLNPTNASAHNNRGGALKLLKRFEEAISSFDEALKLNPNHAGAYNNRGGVFQELGDRDRAIESFQKALSIDPHFPDAHRHLSLLSTYSPANRQHAEIVEETLKVSGLSTTDKMQLHFTLGKIYADCRQEDEAFRHYTIANDLGARRTPYDSRHQTELVDRLIAAFPDRFFDERREHGNESRRPVLVVGMPRSGTTLVEQIISSHPKVEAGGELEVIRTMESTVSRQAGTENPYPESIELLDQKGVSKLSERYLGALRDISESADRVVDKMPRNFLSLGFFKLMFPEAHIIHCRRNPLDTGLSIYFNYFPEGHPYSFDLNAIAHYYNEYARILDHWRSSGHIRMYEVQYEDLVDNQEQLSRELIEHIGLEWDPACIEFHKNKRAVSTASNDQVRRPMYSTSVNRWKAYEHHLQPLMSALNP